MAKLRLASPLQQDSIVDGPGIRMVVWTQGCPHHCPNCHNPQTWDETGGEWIETSSLIAQIQTAPLQSGLTLSGGEPFQQAEALLEVAKAAKAAHLNLWAYSGYTFEQLRQDPIKKALLEQLDVLVDGPFIEAEKDYRLKFKGSKNQRIIDVQASLAQNCIIYSPYDEKNQNLE